MLDTQQYVRKPFYIEAVRVTSKNLAEVSRWCGGKIERVVTAKGPTNQRYIRVKVNRPQTPRQEQAFVGDWVLRSGTSFKVYLSKAFEDSFEPVGKPAVTPRVINDLHIREIGLVADGPEINRVTVVETRDRIDRVSDAAAELDDPSTLVRADG